MHADVQLRDNREIVTVAVRGDGYWGLPASATMQANREVALIAVKQEGRVRYASADLKADREVVLAVAHRMAALLSTHRSTAPIVTRCLLLHALVALSNLCHKSYVKTVKLQRLYQPSTENMHFVLFPRRGRRIAMSSFSLDKSQLTSILTFLQRSRR